MAPPKGSGGRAEALLAGARHQIRAAMTPTLLKASSQKGAAMPRAPTMTPPSAGPIARLTLMPTLLAATADGTEQHAVQRGTAGDLRASDQWQERPVRAAK